MLDLFKEYQEASKVNEALLVGRNMVNKNPGDYSKFKAYMELMLSLAEKLPALDERKNFVSQASITLAFFEENADLSSTIIDYIAEYKSKITELACKINAEEDEKANAGLNDIQSNNAKQLKNLYLLKQKFDAIKTQSEFDSVLQEISLADSKLEHDYLTKEQKVHYDQINRECTASISEKMREIERKNNVEYNKKAVAAYDLALKKFKHSEGTYKNQTQLFSLVSSTLFAFDASRLFNETLIYYNHVYSYIFGKLDDDGKLALTRFSIECERKQR